MPKKPLEKDIQREICEWMHDQAFFFWRNNNFPPLGRFGANGEARFRAMPKYAKRGVPDIWMVRNGVLFGLEVKRPGAKLRPEQADFGLLLEANGGRYEIVHSLLEAKYALAE